MSSTDPLDTNDGWADLARELGLEGGATPPPQTTYTGDELPSIEEPSAEATSDSFIDAEGEPGFEVEPFVPDDSFVGAESEDEDDDAEGEGESEGSGAEGEGEEEGEPGTKKRRRRRRRRKKKGGESTGEEAGDAAVATEESPENAADDDNEGLSPEMTKELIRTWNVPSWEEIVTGLYRPHDR